MHNGSLANIKLIPNTHLVGNKAKGRISKQVLQEN